MSPLPTAAPLDPRWVSLVDRIAPRVLGRDDRTGDALAAEIIRLSELYTRERAQIGLASDALAARLRFFLLRDLPKIQGPLAELALAGGLPSGDTWRVLDLGAGLGTTSLGLAELAKRAGARRLQITAVEQDAASLDVFGVLAREAHAEGLVPEMTLEARRADLESLEIASLPPADLVVMGLALNELYADREEADRLDAREAALRTMVERLRPGGSLVVIEPATRALSRELQTLRDRLASQVFAPCLRDGPCPLLERERDWCHDQLPFDLPEGLDARAESAGLRRQRLTYAYLTLRADGRRLWDVADRSPRAHRVVGGPVRSKGKTEWDLCGQGGLVRLRRIDRERSDASAALDGAERGALLTLDREVKGAALRVRPDVEVRPVDREGAS